MNNAEWCLVPYKFETFHLAYTQGIYFREGRCYWTGAVLSGEEGDFSRIPMLIELPVDRVSQRFARHIRRDNKDGYNTAIMLRVGSTKTPRLHSETESDLWILEVDASQLAFTG